jgi:hypothetical protein
MKLNDKKRPFTSEKIKFLHALLICQPLEPLAKLIKKCRNLNLLINNIAKPLECENECEKVYLSVRDDLMLFN